jgi:hypothetical protein
LINSLDEQFLQNLLYEDAIDRKKLTIAELKLFLENKKLNNKK